MGIIFIQRDPVLPFSLSWLVENGLKYTRSNGGCWKYGPVKADESLVKDLQDHIETSAECAYYKIGSGVSYSCCIQLRDSLLFKLPIAIDN